jgi:hypothetical protein
MDAAADPPVTAAMAQTVKWRLFVKVLPLTGLFALAKFGVHASRLESWEFNSLTGSLFGAATFVIAFVLSGTLSDYNGCEEQLAQLINSVEAIEDINRYLARLKPDLSPDKISRLLAELLLQTRQWLLNSIPFEGLQQVLAQLNDGLAERQQQSGESVCERALPEVAKIRLLLAKMASNRNSDFLGPAYAMLEVFLVGSVMALLLIGSERFIENMVVSCFLFTSFTYLLLLIRDLDNPFQYDGSSAVDIDITCLSDCRDRLLASGLPARSASGDSQAGVSPT